MKKLRNSEKGFTLIELLVVLAILGVIAAFIIPAVAKFIGSGTESSANLEARSVETAVVAYMADNNLSDFDGVISPDSNTGVEEFLSHSGKLQAIYTIEDGVIVSAELIEDSKWGDMEYSQENGWQ